MQPRPMSETEGPLFPRVLMMPLLLQQLECMRPAVAQESGNAPEYAERLDCARPLDRSHIRHVEPELIDAGHFQRGLDRCSLGRQDVLERADLRLAVRLGLQ